LDLVDVDVRRAAGRAKVFGGVVHVIPADRVVEPRDHVNPLRRQHKVDGGKIVLFRRVYGDGRAGLIAWVWFLLGGRCEGQERGNKHNKKNNGAHTLNLTAGGPPPLPAWAAPIPPDST